METRNPPDAKRRLTMSFRVETLAPATGALDGTHLYDLIVSGAGNVILNERNLNRTMCFLFRTEIPEPTSP